MKKVKSLVIGCGSIGALKPDNYDFPGGPNILTHAHAYTKHENIDLVGVVDIDTDKAIRAGRKWNTSADTNYRHAIELLKPDIVSICVPTKYHLNVFKEILLRNHLPKVIILEKPCGMNKEEAQEMQNMSIEYGIPVIVNYTRRFTPYNIHLLKPLMEKSIIYSAHFAYGRGLLRDGCHAIDMLHWLFGNLRGHSKPINEINDLPGDPTQTFSLKFNRCPNVTLAAIDSKAYSVFNLIIYTDTCMVQLHNHGLHAMIYNTKVEETFGGSYQSLNYVADNLGTGLELALMHLVDNAYRVSRKETTPICSLQDAIITHTTIEILRGKENA